MMIIYPHDDKLGIFVIQLTAQELANLIQGIHAAPHPDSPWSRGTAAQMQQAIDDNNAYRSKRWE